MSPDGKHLYVTSIYDDAVTVFSDFISGTLTFVEAQRDGIDTPDWPDHPKDVAVSATVSISMSRLVRSNGE